METLFLSPALRVLDIPAPSDFPFLDSIAPHLADPELDMPKLQRLLGMSRSDLHRKLKLATGMSATEYIRYLRVHRAAQLLLEQPDVCIVGIALEVGFNNHSYFTKRFREVFGVCPKEYRERKGDLGHLL